MRFTWLYRCNDVLNAGLNKLWVRNFIFKNYSALFLAMISILGRCRIPVIVALIGLGIISDLLRRKVIFKPSNSVEAYLRYQRDKVWDRKVERKLFYTAKILLILSGPCSFIFVLASYLMTSHAIFHGNIFKFEKLKIMFYLSPHNFLPKYRNKIIITGGILGTYARLLLVFSFFYFMITLNFVFSTFFAQNFIKFYRIRLYYVFHFRDRFVSERFVSILRKSKILFAVMPISIYLFDSIVFLDKNISSINTFFDSIFVQYGLIIPFIFSFISYLMFVCAVCFQNLSSKTAGNN